MKIKADTIIRTLSLCLALINHLLTMNGKSMIPISDEHLATFIGEGWLIASTIWAWWKNNSFTHAAIAADQTLARLKSGDHA